MDSRLGGNDGYMFSPLISGLAAHGAGSLQEEPFALSLSKGSSSFRVEVEGQGFDKLGPNGGYLGKT